MRLSTMSLLVAASLLVGCNRPKADARAPDFMEGANVWTLQSYNAEGGYVFRKDGVQYVAHCAAVVWTKPKDWDVKQASSEADCAAVLPYLHKSIVLAPGGKSDIIHFDKQVNGVKWTYAFRIVEAK